MSSAAEHEAAPRAVIFGCEGHALSDSEREFFAETRPFGFILFARNVHDPEQLRALTAALRASAGRKDAPVLIDQEGGRVQRLRPPHWRDAPPPAMFGRLYRDSPEDAVRAVRLNARMLAAELHAIGVDVDCLPVLDVPAAGAHEIIGSRAFGDDPAVVAELGRAACDGLLEGGVLPVIKHMPGHGRAGADSHETLPTVDTDRATLAATDFAPFKALQDMPWGMTAHVLYSAIDAERPATLSPIVVEEVIRQEIGFDGLLLTDDLSMKALSGSLADRAAGSLAAGCDVVLHCNGEMAEMREIAGAVPEMGAAALRRFRRGQKMRHDAGAFDAASMEAELTDLLLERGHS